MDDGDDCARDFAGGQLLRKHPVDEIIKSRQASGIDCDGGGGRLRRRDGRNAAERHAYRKRDGKA